MNVDLSISSFDPSTYDNRLYKTVTMGTNINITNNSYQSFWGQDYVLINDGTSIDNGSNKDLKTLENFYRDKAAKYPELFNLSNNTNSKD